MPESLIATKKAQSKEEGNIDIEIVKTRNKKLGYHPNPRMFNMYLSVPSKAMLDAGNEVAPSVFDEIEPIVTIDARLNELRGSINDFVRTGSLISNPECNSPPLLKKYEEQDFNNETGQQSTAKA